MLHLLLQQFKKRFFLFDMLYYASNIRYDTYWQTRTDYRLCTVRVSDSYLINSGQFLELIHTTDYLIRGLLPTDSTKIHEKKTTSCLLIST